MRKFAALLLSVALLISLTACGGTETSQQENTRAGGRTERSENNGEEAPNAEAEGDVELGQTADIDDGFIFIMGGTFQMGSPDTENWRSDDETQHTVTVSDFYMSPYEVTQVEYEEVVGSNPSSFSGGRFPVENISWLDAVSFCNAYSEEKGLEPVYSIDGQNVSWNRGADGYRLPTEAEWEYACRAGTETAFYMENSPSAEEANYYGHYPYEIEGNYFSQE